MASPHLGFAIKKRMKPYCKQIDASDWASASAMDLINQKICPPWVLPSTDVIGRCLPTLVETGDSGNKGDPNATVFDHHEAPGGEVKEGTIERAVYALGTFLQV